MADVPNIFDRAAYRLRRARAATYGDSYLIREAASGLSERLSAVNRRFENALDVGSSDQATGVLNGSAKHWTRIDFGEHDALAAEGGAFDLATSVLALHTINDLPGALIQIRHALKPDGLFMAALFGGDTLREVRDVFASGEEEIRGGTSPRVSPFADVRDLGALLQRAGFALPVADSERTTIRYRTFDRLISDLRAAGETNVLMQRSRKPLRRDVLAASLSHYAHKHAEADGRLRATFEIVYLTGWAPHESQQKALRPGSARARLADVLGSSEQSAGDSTPMRRN